MICSTWLSVASLATPSPMPIEKPFIRNQLFTMRGAEVASKEALERVVSARCLGAAGPGAKRTEALAVREESRSLLVAVLVHDYVNDTALWKGREEPTGRISYQYQRVLGIR